MLPVTETAPCAAVAKSYQNTWYSISLTLKSYLLLNNYHTEQLSAFCHFLRFKSFDTFDPNYPFDAVYFKSGEYLFGNNIAADTDGCRSRL